MRAWIDHLSSCERRVIARAMRLCGASAQAQLLTSRRSALLSDSTRQARHARLLRARAVAVASAVVIAVDDPEVRAFVLSPEFARLRPFTAAVQPKYSQLRPLAQRRLDLSRCVSQFEHGAAVLFDVVKNTATLSQTDLLRFNSALCLMYVGPIAHRDAFAAPWHEVWEHARASGLLANRELRLRLALLGAWAGSDQALLDASLDATLVPTALAGGYCYLRSDTLDDVFARNAEIIRGEDVDPTHCLLPERPVATLRQAIIWARMTLREVQYLRRPGQALFLLSAIAHVCEHIATLLRRNTPGIDTENLTRELHAFERVQVMEKRRFFALSERMPESAAKERVLALWQRSCAAWNDPTSQLNHRSS